MEAIIDVTNHETSTQFFFELIGYHHNKPGYNSWEKVVLFRNIHDALAFQKELNSLPFKYDEYDISNNILPPMLAKELSGLEKHYLCSAYPYEIYMITTTVNIAFDEDIRKTIINELLIDAENESRT